MPFGSIVAGIGSIFGGLLGSKDAEKDRQLQLDMAKNRISWTAADARKAGIHPLAALGASYPGYTPVGSPLGQGVARGAEHLGRAADQATKKSDPVAASAIRVNDAQARLLEAQAQTLTLETKLAAIGATSGARNVSSPAHSPNPARESVTPLFIPEATGTRGQTIRNLPDMKIAPDLETTVAARLEDGSILPWLRKLWQNNSPTFREAMRFIFAKGANPTLLDRIYEMQRNTERHDRKRKPKSDPGTHYP